MTKQDDIEPDPFDPKSLRLGQDFSAAVGVRKLLLSVAVRKPTKSDFVRVHPGEDYRLTTLVLELKEERETYLITRNLWSELASETTCGARTLFTAINRHGVLFIWPVKSPGPDGRVDEWSRTSSEAANLAMKSWVRITANMSLGAYEVHQATGQLSEPDWPGIPFKDILKIAFQDKYIQDREHPVLRRLRGEV